MLRSGLLFFFVSLVAACSENTRASAPAPTASAGMHARGPGPAASTDPVGAALHRQVVARAGDMEEVGTTVRGEFGEGETHTYPLVLIGTWCYRIFAQGGAGMEDLELELIDPNGVPAQRDPDEGPSASLGLADGICPYYAGRYTLQVRAARGHGAYAFRVFRKQVL